MLRVLEPKVWKQSPDRGRRCSLPAWRRRWRRYLFWRYLLVLAQPAAGSPGRRARSSAPPTARWSTSNEPRPDEPIIVCKQGKAASINDIVREEMGSAEDPHRHLHEPLQRTLQSGPVRRNHRLHEAVSGGGQERPHGLHALALHVAAAADLCPQPAHYAKQPGRHPIPGAVSRSRDLVLRGADRRRKRPRDRRLSGRSASAWRRGRSSA